MARCTAHKKDGEQCRKSARIGYRVCTHHGAGYAKKPGGRPITTGRYSKRFTDVQAALIRAQAAAAQRELQTKMMRALYDGLPSVLRCLEARGDCDELKDELVKLDADTQTHESMIKLTKLLSATAIEWAADHVPTADKGEAKRAI